MGVSPETGRDTLEPKKIIEVKTVKLILKNLLNMYRL